MQPYRPVKAHLAVLFLALALPACRDRSERSSVTDEAAATAPKTVADAPPEVAGSEEDDEPDYVPAEHKSGAARWKDTIVYVDGQPRGALTFGELPVPLEPTWVEEESPREIRPNSDDPGFVMVKKRRYRFTDYLQAIGVEVSAIKALHIYGPKFTESIIASGALLRSKQGKGLLFRFASEVGGKTIPVVPPNFGNGRSPDKISSVMVYVKRTPPKLVEHDGFYLDGEKVAGVPYYGEPLRGGVRVYLDNRMVAVIKRQELKPEAAEKLADGSLRWKLAEFLADAGVDLTGVTQAWVVRDERRQEVLEAAELANATFEAAPQAHGEVLFGAQKLRAQAIALHHKPLTRADLPVVLPDEE
ncbi:MAG: hypothetical protein R3B48_01745 [Kofleriaceae bacterium]